MRLIALFICVLLVTACAAKKEYVENVMLGTNGDFSGVAKQQYVQGTEDLPIYYGFEASEDTVAYDSVNGRIIDANFVSKNAPAAEVRKFYETVLPQLGWAKQEYQLYKREGELLRINIIEREDDVLLKISISPN